MIKCDLCAANRCSKNETEGSRDDCPMNEGTQFYDELLAKYDDEKVKRFFVACAEIEAEGYCRWPRIREIVELGKKMDYKKIGIAFCIGLQDEARTIAGVLRKHDFEVVSAVCKTGGIPKESVGVPRDKKILPDYYEPMCNPIAQAALLNREKTDFNVVVGLCVGHDSLFFKNSEAFATVLVAKDRVLAHNPIGAIYCKSYYSAKL